MARQAGREGWILALWHFARRHQRLPVGAEIGQCVRDARDLDEAIQICRTPADTAPRRRKPYAGWIPLGQTDDCTRWLSTGVRMLQKRRELAAEAHEISDEVRQR